MQVNIFTITNLSELCCQYRLYKVKGLVPTSDDYDKNASILTKNLSELTKSPCIVIREGNDTFVARPSSGKPMPDRVPLVGIVALIEETDIIKVLNYDSLSDEELPLAVRFLQFYLNGTLYANMSLWQPSSGQPFYRKEPDRDFAGARNVDLYRGFKLRPIVMPNNKIGLCVDIVGKYVSRCTLPPRITLDDFVHKFKKKKVVYEYGDRWYEITAENLSDLNVSQVQVNGQSLYDHLHARSRSKSQNLLKMPTDCSVITYQTSTGIKNVPSALCRLTFSTSHPAVRDYHASTIMPPWVRRREIEFVVSNYLGGLTFGDIPVRLSVHMIEMELGRFVPPDLQFGGNKVLSVGDGIKPTAQIEQIGPMKRSWLQSPDAGFYVKKKLDRQYLIVPRSISETFGAKFTHDLKEYFRLIYSRNGKHEYEPSIIVYDDSVRKSIYTLGNEIIRKVSQNVFYAGFGLVVIPSIGGGLGREDELGNLVMSELRKKGMYVSVMHTDKATQSYAQVAIADGSTTWDVINDERISKKFRGYMSNVVLNKILLLNSCWPFVLANPLHADLIIGIDVKNHTAGFTVVHKNGQEFGFSSSRTDDKERLSKNHVSSKLYQVLISELEEKRGSVQTIAVHRDGTLYTSEMQGIVEALNRLEREGVIRQGYDCNFLEIRKSSRIPVRFFDTTQVSGSLREETRNPWLGTYGVFADSAFICNTGRPYRYDGTAKPLQVTKVSGSMDFRLLLQDVFNLANLTWTRIDYCSRVPLTIKMTDIRLREIAGAYNEDELRFAADQEETE
jgi:hypothetical protein